MVNVPSFQAASYLGKFFRDAGYDASHLGQELELDEGLHANRENLESLLIKTEGDSCLSILARLFFVSWPVDQERCRAGLPERFLEAALQCDLLYREGANIVSSASVFPFRSLLLACDPVRSRSSMRNMVAGPSASSYYPARLAIGGENEITLDLGTGTGALALEAMNYSSQVVGTDLNPRCLRFAEFNSAFNGVQNIEWLCGDAFSPVDGRKFTRIVANPPFFLTPVRTFVYSDSPMELDGFAARLASESTKYLHEGGFFQMICEWVEIEGQPWEHRIRNWTGESQCDVLVLTTSKMTPLAYAERLTRERTVMQTGGEANAFGDRYRYLIERGVTKIVGGTIHMRKRAGRPNWFSVLNTEAVGRDIGYDVRSRFENLTYLATISDLEILEGRFSLSEEILLNTTLAASNRKWQVRSIGLSKPLGLTDQLNLDETVSRFLPLFDGSQTLQQIAGLVAADLSVGIEAAQKRCVQLTRRLLQSNFVSIAR